MKYNCILNKRETCCLASEQSTGRYLVPAFMGFVGWIISGPHLFPHQLHFTGVGGRGYSDIKQGFRMGKDGGNGSLLFQALHLSKCLHYNSSLKTSWTCFVHFVMLHTSNILWGSKTVFVLCLVPVQGFQLTQWLAILGC